MPVHLEFGPEVFLHFSAQQLADENDEVYEKFGPGSIRDAWKKFELSTPPTPPLSPSRQTTDAVSPSYLTTTAADTLQCVSDILDLDNQSCRTSFVEHSADHSCTNLTSKLIQDCMWGSHSLREKIQCVSIEDVYDTPCSTPPSLYLDYVDADCVDPTSVFPYHINNQDFVSGELSSSEEEIDVVTVSISEKPVKRKCSTPCNNMTKTLRHLDQPSAKRPKLSQKRPRENMNKDIKESCLETDQDASNRLSGKDKVEDPECKRNVHNVLERKRRNDLKYSFQVLRDSIPDLKGSERAPKVAILRKATDCILNLRSEQERLLEEKSILERTHQSLQQKLKALKESA